MPEALCVSSDACNCVERLSKATSFRPPLEHQTDRIPSCGIRTSLREKHFSPSNRLASFFQFRSLSRHGDDFKVHYGSSSPSTFILYRNEAAQFLRRCKVINVSASLLPMLMWVTMHHITLHKMRKSMKNASFSWLRRRKSIDPGCYNEDKVWKLPRLKLWFAVTFIGLKKLIPAGDRRGRAKNSFDWFVLWGPLNNPVERSE